MEISVLKYINSLDRHYEILFNDVTKAARVILIPPDLDSASEPPIGWVVHSACDSTTLDEVIYDGGNRVHYSGTLNSVTCGYVEPNPEDPTPEVPVTYNSTKQYTYICPTNYTGSFTATSTAYSTLSQLDADNKALLAAKSIAESSAVCVINIQMEDLVDGEGNNGWTISYMPELKSWSSFHNYYPTLMLSNSNDVLLIEGSQIHTFSDIATPCTYFNVFHTTYLELIFNKETLQTKVFDNLLVQSNQMFDDLVCINETGISGKNIMMRDSLDYTDEEDEVSCKYKNSQYQLPVPRATDDARFRGKYLKVGFSKRPYSKMLVKYITMLFRLNAR